MCVSSLPRAVLNIAVGKTSTRDFLTIESRRSVEPHPATESHAEIAEMYLCEPATSQRTLGEGVVCVPSDSGTCRPSCSFPRASSQDRLTEPQDHKHTHHCNSNFNDRQNNGNRNDFLVY